VDQDCIKLTTCSSRRRAGSLPDDDGIPVSVLLRGTGLSRFPARPPRRDPGSILAIAETVSVGRPCSGTAADAGQDSPGSGLVTFRRARFLSGDIDPVGWGDDAAGQARLTVYLSRRDHVYQVPAAEVICELLHRRGAAEAFVLPAIIGTLRDHDDPRSWFASRSAAPVMVVAIGPGARLGLALPELGGLLRRPLVTLEQVRLCKRAGQLVGLPPATPDADAGGLPLWQRLTVYAPRAARHDGRPVHRAITRRLRDAGVSRTTLHGTWGFGGGHAPLGRRDVPSLTIVIGTPERIQPAFSVIDEVTGSQALVTCETVTVSRAADQGP
jgi:PII-like signaling protein